MPEEKHVCIVCERSSQEVPLLSLELKGEQYWVCPSDLPILIHKPDKLAGKLPGVENLRPHEH